MLCSFLMITVSAVLRVSVDENAVVDHRSSVVAQATSPGKDFRRGMMSRLVGKIVCHGGCSRSVCSSSKASSNETALQRYDYKMAKIRTLAEYLAKKKCTYRLVGGLGEFRGNVLPRSCAAHWAEFDQRMMAFESCTEVAKDGESQLSKAVWGLGDAAFQAVHASLDGFMRDILLLVNAAYNGNTDIQSMLKEGGCTLNLDVVSDELAAVEKDAAGGVPLKESLDKLDRAVFGPSCDFEAAKMPWIYMRMRLMKSVRGMLHGVVEMLLSDKTPQVEDLAQLAVDEADSSDDAEVAAAEQQLLGGSDSSLIQLESEPVVTTTTVTIGTGIIIAAAVGGAAVLTIIGLVLRALMMTRRITFKDRTNA
jgi:hypothetical protein